MINRVEALAEQAMGLPAESRARLAELLVDSLDGAALERVDALWIAEAKRRRDDVRSGRVAAVPGEEALSRARDSVR